MKRIRQITSRLNKDAPFVQNYKPDCFFSAAQLKRLTELKLLSQQGNLSIAEENELEDLIESELNAARQRAKRLIE